MEEAYWITSKNNNEFVDICIPSLGLLKTRDKKPQRFLSSEGEHAPYILKLLKTLVNVCLIMLLFTCIK